MKDKKSAKQSNDPIMQDLSDSKSMISQAFARITPPTAPFDPEAEWTHVYEDYASHSLKRALGSLSLTHRGGKLRIQNYRNCPQGYRSYTFADLDCTDDLLRSPKTWTVETKVSKAANAPAYLNSGLVKQASITNNVLTIKTAGNSRSLELPGPTTCKWCLLDAVGRMATAGIEEVCFSLLDEYDELCPRQLIRFTGEAEVNTPDGVVAIKSYQHTGVATVPGVFYVDSAGRVRFYLGDMQLLALTQKKGGMK